MQCFDATDAGVKGKPADNFEHDLLLTMQIIRDHAARSTTVGTEQFLQQQQQVAEIEKEHEVAPTVVDISIPYDAAAQLAYQASGKSMDFANSKAQYEANAVADVIAKQPIDISNPLQCRRQTRLRIIGQC